MKIELSLFLIVLISYFELYETVPTFGDEFVHIKVHLPKEGGDAHADAHAHAHGPPIHAHPIVHAPVIPPPHKVIHHYHHKRRRPAKKPSTFSKHSGLLESIILSEVKKPISSDHLKYLNHAEDIAKHVDTFLVKPEKPKPHIETFKLIEETKPKENVETFKVIENKIPAHFHQDDISPTGTFDDGYNYKPSKPIETYKVIDGLFDDYHTHINEPNYKYGPPKKKQHVKTLKIIDSHDHEPTGNYGYSSNDYTTHGDDYHYASKPHVDTVKIVETKAPHQHSHEYSFNFDKRPHSETVKIVQTSTPSKSSSYYPRHQQNKHFDDSHQHQGYQYEHPSLSHGNTGSSYDDDDFTAGYDYKAPNYHDSYKTITDEHYAQEPEDSYLPPKRPSANHHNHNHHHHHHQQQPQQHHNHYASNVHQNTIYDDEQANPADSYLPPLPPIIPELDGVPSYGDTTINGHKATETYSGIDSYSASHVQGVGSGGYSYPMPYP